MEIVKKPDRDLPECAEALRKLSVSSQNELFDELIEEGYFYLRELKASPKCNPLQVRALAQRIERAEQLLEQKQKCKMS